MCLFPGFKFETASVIIRVALLADKQGVKTEIQTRGDPSECINSGLMEASFDF